MNPEEVLEWVHPSLAIASYVFVIINAIITFTKSSAVKQNITIWIAWILCFGGLITGIIWAELAWGRLWSWDPKEVGTLLLLLSISATIYVVQRSEIKRRWLLVFTITNLLFMIFTLLVSPALDSIHTDYSTLTWLANSGMLQ